MYLKKSSFTWVIYFLIFQSIGFPHLAFSKNNRPKTDSVKLSDSKKKPKVAVIELSDGRIKPKHLTEVTDDIRDQLVQLGKFEVISKAQTDQFFQRNQHLLQRVDSKNVLNRYLEESKEFYKNFAFKDAIKLLENTIYTYRNTAAVRDQNFLLTDAYLLLGRYYLSSKNKKKTVEVLKEAIRLDPKQNIDPKIFPPNMVQLHEKTRGEYLQKLKPSVLEVNSSPSQAKVFVNGNYQGVSPLKITHFTPGEHFVLVQKEGYLNASSRVILNEKKNQKPTKEKITLKKNPKDSFSTRGINVEKLSDVQEQVRLGTKVGHSLGVEKVVLVSVEEIGWNHKVIARMIDLKYLASHKPKSVQVLDFPKNIKSASKVLAKDLNQLAGIDLAKNPKKYAESEVVVIGKKKKPLYKNPILWSLLGVAVAGGTATAILLTRDGPTEVGFGGGPSPFQGRR